MDGIFEAEGDPSVNFVDLWNGVVQTNDMVNANTGNFDPRHLFGTSNQDVFRWPSIKNGTHKQVLGLYIITFLFPGAPILNWGEEQAFYVLENTNANCGNSLLHPKREVYSLTGFSVRSISNVFGAGLAATSVLHGRLFEIRPFPFRKRRLWMHG